MYAWPFPSRQVGAVMGRRCSNMASRDLVGREYMYASIHTYMYSAYPTDGAAIQLVPTLHSESASPAALMQAPPHENVSVSIFWERRRGPQVNLAGHADAIT